MSPAQNGQHPDIKPRSRVVTDGLERAAARGMLRAVGMGDDDWAKPQIGVASSWNEITPCNLSLDRLAKAAKEGVHAAGGFPLEFGTISVSDGISMGHVGHALLAGQPRGHRRLRRDGVRGRAPRRLRSCSPAATSPLPGMLMAAARLDVAAVFLYAGSILPGPGVGRQRTSRSSTRSRRWARAPRGLITPRGGRRDRARDLPGRGRLRRHVHRQHDGRAPSRRWACRCPARPRRPPSTGAATASRAASGEAVVELLRRGITARDIITRSRSRTRSPSSWPSAARPTPCCTCWRSRTRRDVDLDARRLQPHRRQGAAPRRPEAVRPVRHDATSTASAASRS